MNLEDLRKIKPVTKLKPICVEAGINYETLRTGLRRGSPELSAEDSAKLVKVLKKYFTWIAKE